MKHILRNAFSVLVWRTDRYCAPRRPALVSSAAAAGTTGAALLVFGAFALWVICFAYLLALIAVPVKVLASEDAVLRDDDTGPVLARAMFAASVALWPIGLALAADLPAALVGVVVLHGVVQVWRQVVLTRIEAVADVEAAERRFTRAGPAIGTFRGREIAAWLVDAQGTLHEFVGCTPDPLAFALHPGQTLVRPGIIYEARGRAA